MAPRSLGLCLLLSVLPSGEQEDSAHQEAHGVYECGVASVYGVLSVHGVSVSLEGVRARMVELFPGVRLDRLSLEQLRRTVESYGLHALSVEVDPRRPSAIPTPGIMYLRPNRVRNKDVGHVLVLKSIDEQEAVIVDFCAGVGARTIPTETLIENWDREMLLVSKTSIQDADHSVRIGALVAAVGSGIALVWWWRRRNTNGRT